VTEIERQEQFCCCADAAEVALKILNSTAQISAALKLLLALHFGHGFTIELYIFIFKLTRISNVHLALRH
jgi:hypothetical protein